MTVKRHLGEFNSESALPHALLKRLWQGKYVRLDTSTANRVPLLKEDYPHFLAAPEALNSKIGFLIDLHGKAVIESL